MRSAGTQVMMTLGGQSHPHSVCGPRGAEEGAGSILGGQWGPLPQEDEGLTSWRKGQREWA